MIIELEEKKINLKRQKEPMLLTIITKLIDHKHPDRTRILEYIFSENKKIKFDSKAINSKNKTTTFLETMIVNNDMELINKYKQFLNIDSNNYNIIHSCTIIDNVELMSKYINNSTNLDKIINDYTPLLLAIKHGSYNCFVKLLENGADPLYCIYDIDQEMETMIGLIFYEIKNKIIKNDDITKHIDMLKYYVNYINDLSKNNSSRNLFNMELDSDSDLSEIFSDDSLEVHYGDEELKQFVSMIDAIKDNDVYSEQFNTIVNTIPNILTFKIQENSIGSYICNYCNDIIINNLIENYNNIFLEDINIIHRLTITGKIKHVKKIIDILPNLLYETDMDKRTLIETAVLSQQIDITTKLETIDFFYNNGVNIDNINRFGCRSLDITIQYEQNTDIIKKIAGYSSKESKFLCSYSFAVQNNKLEALKILIESDHKFKIKNNIPECMTKAIFSNNYELLKYIINEPTFQITEEVLNKTYNKFKRGKERCDDITLNILNKNHTIRNEFVFDEGSRKLDGLLKMLIIDYTNDKLGTIIKLKLIVTILLKILENTMEKPHEKIFIMKRLDDYQKLMKIC